MKATVKRFKALSFAAFAAALLFFFGQASAEALESASPSILQRGQLQVDGAAGAVVTDREYHFGWDLLLRVGITSGVEAASPMALAVRLAGTQNAGSLYIGLGIVDLYMSSEGGLLFEPSFVLAGDARFGPEAAFRGALDITGAEKGIQRGDHALWLRGSIGLVLDMGQVATLAFGLSYQRSIVEGAHPEDLERTGWAGDSRISIGSVRTQPFSDLPLFSIHLQPGADFIILMRFDINAEEKTSDIRCLVGFSLMLLSENR